MPEEHCFVCASNEGIFLDVFADGRNYRDIIETCLSLKVQKKKMRSSKICHKCVYELDQCSKFVQRYKKTHRIEKGKLYKKRGCCCLCMEPGKKGYIFDLWDESRLDSSVEKLNELFAVDFVTDNLGNLSICLDCRYNLDVLVDMKSLFKDTSRFLEKILNGDMNLSELPKISTSVVKRQTTLTRTSKLSHSKSLLTESDTSTIVLDSPKRVRAMSSRKLSPHERKCDECNATIDNGRDIYRYHHTGNTVCKECVLTMDPCGKTKGRAHKINDTTMKTKLCSVFLEDILPNALETEKRTSSCKVEKGTDGEVIYIISSDETDNENDSKMLSTRLTRTKRKEPAVETKPKKKLKTQHPRRAKLTRSNSAQSINQINKRSTRLTRSESAETSDSEGKKLRKRSETIGKSVASTSKPKREKKSKESQTRAAQPKKRKTNKSDSSSSSNEIILPSKVRRFSSPSYKIDSNESKAESDSENGPYVCKICSNDFENRVLGKTHELTHSKKLGVMLEKVAILEQSEEEEKLETKPSTEINSPARSDGEQTEIATDVHSATTDGSTLGQVSEIHEDLSDDDSHTRSPRAATATEYDEDRSEVEQRKKRDTRGAKTINKDTVKNKKRSAEKNKKKGTAKERDKKNEKIEETDNENISVEQGDKKNGVEEKEEIESNTEKEQDKKGETEKELSSSGLIQDNESVHETNGNDTNNIDEQPAETDKPNPCEEISELNDKDSSENIQIAQNKVSAEEKNDEVIENEIENVEKNTSNSSEKNEKLLDNDEKVNEGEKDSASPSAILEQSNGKLIEESNETTKEDATIENGKHASENKEADESKEADKKQEDEGGKKEVVSEEKYEEKTTDETISNGNVKKLSNVESAVTNDDDDDGVTKSGEPEHAKQSEKSEECSDLNVKDTGEKNDDVATDETNNTAHSGEAESRVACTENDIDHERGTKNESIEIENRLAEMMGESESKGLEERDEKTSDDIKKIEQTPPPEATAIENSNCES